MSRFTLLINSSDGYEDCWGPFFALLRTHWPEVAAPIMVSTESRSMQVDGLDVRWAVHESNVDRRRLRWGARLLDTLQLIQTPLVLMTLDDFFIKDRVDLGGLDRVVSAMIAERVGHVQLCEPNKPFVRFGHPVFVQKGDRSEFRVSLQMGLWTPDCLRKHVRRHENPWQTEVFGTRRSWRIADRFLALDPDYVAEFGLPIPYDDTGGIARGKWYREKVEDLFAQHRICVDFAKRGWYRPGVDVLPRASLFRRVIDRVRSSV